MKKIFSLFKRDYEGTRLVYNEVVEGAEWVTQGEGTATRKWDGTPCLLRDRKLYKRHTIKKGKTTPPEFEAETEVDPNTGKQQGWLPVGDGPEDKWYWEALRNVRNEESQRNENILWDGTYELVGPNIQGNPEGFPEHTLVRHGIHVLSEVPRNFDELRAYLELHGFEGIVWHHPDGRMVKIKGKDFGIKRGPKNG